MSFDFSSTSGVLETVFNALLLSNVFEATGKLEEAHLVDALGGAKLTVKKLTDLHADYTALCATEGYVCCALEHLYIGFCMLLAPLVAVLLLPV
jgi:hypothetical protein